MSKRFLWFNINWHFSHVNRLKNSYFQHRWNTKECKNRPMRSYVWCLLVLLLWYLTPSCGLALASEWPPLALSQSLPSALWSCPLVPHSANSLMDNLSNQSHCYRRHQHQHYYNILIPRVLVTRMRGSAIRSVRSQWQSQWDRRNFTPLPLPNP